MIRTIVFDFGNVIGFFDSRKALRRLLEHTDLSQEGVRAAFVAADLEDAYESGRLGTDEFLRRLREVGRFTCGDGVLTEAWSDIFWPNPDVCALLPRLKPRYRLLLGSNTNELHARQFQKQFAEPLRHFDALVLSHEVGVRKPRAGFFEHCRKLAGCAPSECLFIDDLADNVAGARSLGWHGIVYVNIDDLRARLLGLGVAV